MASTSPMSPSKNGDPFSLNRYIPHENHAARNLNVDILPEKIEKQENDTVILIAINI
jgi:hypothetical protein